MKTNILFALLSSVLLVMTFTVTANATPEAPNFDLDRLEQIVKRLKLSDAQRQAVRPIIIGSLIERALTLKEAGFKKGQKSSILQLLKVRDPIRKVRAETEARLSKVLNSEQIVEYRIIMIEERKKFHVFGKDLH
jgi:hypothetical protein